MEERDSTVKISATVYRELKEQTKAVTYQSNGVFSITPDVGYWLSNVSVTVDVAGGGALPVGTKFAYSTFSQIPTAAYNEADMKYLFRYCSNLTTITFPTGSLKDTIHLGAAFNGCVRLQSVTFPSEALTQVTSLESTFASCNALTSLSFVDPLIAVQNIKDMCSNCTKLQSIVFPDGSLTNVYTASGAFHLCTSLSSITFPNGALTQVTSMKGCFEDCSHLQSIIFPTGALTQVTNIMDCFAGCVYLTSITFPDGALTQVEFPMDCFKYCSKLQTLNIWTLPEISLTNAGFTWCVSLTPRSLMSIIEALPNTTKGYKCTLGTTNLSKLSTDQILIATNKGWTLN